MNETELPEKSSNVNINVFSVIVNLALSISIPLLMLFLEYHSGYFQARNNTNQPLAFPVLVILFSCMLASLLFYKEAIVIGVQSEKYMRENFSIIALLTLIPLCVMACVSLLTGIMPWYLFFAVFHLIFSGVVYPYYPNWTDYVLIIFTIYSLYLPLSHIQKSWIGKKSLQQYDREQNNKRYGLLQEAISEVNRILFRREPIEPIIDSVSWRDQSKNLLTLSLSSSFFDPDNDWHSRQGYWVGTDTRTDEIIGLFPTYIEPDIDSIRNFVRYTKKIGANRKKQIADLVVAIRDSDIEKTLRIDNIPVRIESENSLLKNLVDFRDYIREIRKRVELEPLPESNLCLKDIFVDSSVFVKDNNSLVNAHEHFLNWIGESSQKHIALLGEYGQGKSTTALMFTYFLLENRTIQNWRMPILIELRGSSPRSLSPLQLFGAWASTYRIDPQSLMRLLIAGRILLIFEGFDEMALVGDTEMRLKHFKTLWKFAYPKAKILITGRPNFFLDEEEMKNALGISYPIGDRPYCESIRLAPFSLLQIEKALRSKENSIKAQICNLASINKRFYEIISRPSLLYIVSILWEKEKLYEKVEQLTSAYVMERFVRYSYRRQGLKEKDKIGFMALNTRERDYFMKGIATHMAKYRMPNQINNSQLNQLILTLIDNMPDSISTDSTAISGEVAIPLRIRIKESQYSVEHVQTDVRTCGILVDDPTSTSSFRFGHKSFMEYLFAAVLSDYIQEKDLLGSQAIFVSTGAKISDLFALPGAIEFLSEMIAPPQNSDLDSRNLIETEIVEIDFMDKLLYSISGKNTFSHLLDRFELANEAYIYSSKHLSEKYRFFVSVFSPFIVLPLLLIITIFIIIERNFRIINITDQSDAQRYILYLISFTLATFSISILFHGRILSKKYSLYYSGVIKSKLQLWNYICNILNLSERSMFKYALISWVPWVKGKKFQYFLPKHWNTK